MAIRWGSQPAGAAPAQLTEQEINDLRTKAQEVETLKAQQTEREQQFAQQTSEMDQLKARFAELENRRATPPPNPAPNNPPAIPSIMDDEDGAFAARQAPLIQGFLSVAAQTARLTAEQRIRSNPQRARLYDKYRVDVDRLLATVPAQFQQFPETVERVFSQVLGDHIEDLAAEAAKTGGSFFTEPGGGAPPPPAVQSDKLTPDEEVAARKMKISPEKYLASKKQMQSAGGHISFAHVETA